MSVYKVPYEASIWDVAVFTVGVENAINVVNITSGWDSDLSELWATEITLPDISVKQEALQRRFIVKENPETAEIDTLYLQTVYDIALQVYGDASKSFTVLNDNNLGFDDIIPQGLTLSYSTQNDQNRLLKEISKRGIQFVTGELILVDSDSSFLWTENQEYIITEFGEKINVG